MDHDDVIKSFVKILSGLNNLQKASVIAALGKALEASAKDKLTEGAALITLTVAAALATDDMEPIDILATASAIIVDMKSSEIDEKEKFIKKLNLNRN